MNEKKFARNLLEILFDAAMKNRREGAVLHRALFALASVVAPDMHAQETLVRVAIAQAREEMEGK